MAIKIQTMQIGDVAVITITGDFDSRSNQHLDKTLKTLSISGVCKIVLDVSSLRFIGNQTVSVLISNLKELRAAGGNIKILNPQRQVIDYLKQNRIFEIFEIFPSRAEAVNSYKTGKGALSAEELDKTAPARAGEAPSFSEAPSPRPSAAARFASTGPQPPAQDATSARAKFETDEVLYANSCMLTALVKLLEKKKVITAGEARELLQFEPMAQANDENPDASSQ
ncbi:MAG: STAS domain-containing protein [bacterium]|nr:STAS domain-containing protein [bacterium]